MLRFLVAALTPLAAPSMASAGTVCTIVADAADGRVLVERGDCRTRVTPASTFKVPLAVMGFDAGVIADARTPVLPFEPGDPDWGGAAWRRPTDPAGWMKHSVVWYSQRIARELGAETLRRYAASFGYGNADFSGDPGKGNGLERAWIGSSLVISPLEQVQFLGKLVNRALPVPRGSMDAVETLLDPATLADGWSVRGKTGSAFPRRADGTFDRDRGWGWFVGWARKGGRTLVFARLAQDEGRVAGPGGLRARDAFLSEFPALLSSSVEAPAERSSAEKPAEGARAGGWAEEKCARYRTAWDQLVARRGKQGLGPEFLERHDAFLASGCTAKAEVCPRSPAELDAANILVMAAMNAGTASTFPPFACRRS